MGKGDEPDGGPGGGVAGGRGEGGRVQGAAGGRGQKAEVRGQEKAPKGVRWFFLKPETCNLE